MSGECGKIINFDTIAHPTTVRGNGRKQTDFSYLNDETQINDERIYIISKYIIVQIGVMSICTAEQIYDQHEVLEQIY